MKQIIYKILKSHRIYWYLYRRKFFKSLNQHKDNIIEQLSDKKKIFFFLAADYGNLGDYAITIAQKKFIELLFPDYKLIIVKLNETNKAQIYSRDKTVNKDDIVTIVGGGNMGSLYYSIELCRQYVISNFTNSPIICFPQSIYTDKDAKGKYVLKQIKKFYTSKKNQITLLFREELSYNKAKIIFPNNKVKLVPDIVLTLDEIKESKRDEEILFCMRDDKEVYISEHLITNIETYLKKEGYRYTKSDTYIGKGLFDNNTLDKEFENLLNRFRKSKLVVTDRLHGMIFAYITGTPAIIFPNNNGKIEYSYKWIKDCEYIQYCTIPTIDDFIHSFKVLKNYKFDYNKFCSKRKEFINLIKASIKKE